MIKSKQEADTRVGRYKGIVMIKPSRHFVEAPHIASSDAAQTQLFPPLGTLAGMVSSFGACKEEAKKRHEEAWLERWNHELRVISDIRMMSITYC